MNYFPLIPATSASLSRRKPIFGLGINDSDYVTDLICNGERVRCPFYVCWTNMLNRAVNPKYKSKCPTYNQVSVCDEWILFSNFREWMIANDWYDRQLDKDIKTPNNKVYSPENCLFVTNEVNMITNDHAAMRGSLSQGVTLCKRSGKFLAQISRYGKKGIKLGIFNSEKDAHEAYCSEKSRYIIELSEKSENKGYREYLLFYAANINGIITS